MDCSEFSGGEGTGVVSKKWRDRGSYSSISVSSGKPCSTEKTKSEPADQEELRGTGREDMAQRTLYADVIARFDFVAGPSNLDIERWPPVRRAHFVEYRSATKAKCSCASSHGLTLIDTVRTGAADHQERRGR